MRESIVAIIFLPVMLMFLVGFYILIGIGWALILVVGMIKGTIDFLRTIDYGMSYEIKTKRKKIK